MGDVIRVDQTTVNSLISQVRAYDQATADRLSLVAGRAKTDADLANVYAAASSALRRYEGDAGGALARSAGRLGASPLSTSGVSLDPETMAFLASFSGEPDVGSDGLIPGRPRDPDHALIDGYMD